MRAMRSGSSQTSSRGSAHSRRYRTRAPTSEVDETLFGKPTPQPTSSQLDTRGNSASKVKNQSPKNKEGETLQIVTKDLIRNLRIPFKDPSRQTTILPSAEFKRITSDSQIHTKEDREALDEAFRRKKEEEEAIQERKRQILEADLSRKENHTLTELELEARDRAQRLVERANALKMEEEEEIRKLNNLILGAQCQATRDAQIQEKKQIKSELSEEEKRLDAMMERDRRNALETVEQIDGRRKQQRISGMQQICNQIQVRREEKQMQEELKEMERLNIRENQEKNNQKDIEALQKKKEEQSRLQEEIMRINAETMRAKERRREEEKMVDLRNMEYIKNKMEQEAKYEAEQRKIKKEKELEINRLRARQERAKDFKAEKDELRARRNQEAADREWRKREKDKAVKKMQEEAMLRAARLEQVQCKEHFRSMDTDRERAELERLLKAQQEAIIKMKEEKEKKHQKAQHHAEAIRHQVKECELAAIAKRRETFKEAERLVEEARLRRVRLDEIKEKKLNELRATGLADKYCSEVERKARANVL